MQSRSPWSTLLVTIAAAQLMYAATTQSGLSSNQESLESLLKRGFELHRQAQFAQAIPVLEQARTIEPNNYFANLLLGIDELRVGNPRLAVPRLQLAARLRTGEAIPMEYLGEAQARLGNYALAASAYQAAVARGGTEDALESWAGFALERFHDLGERLRASDAGVAALERMHTSAADPVSELRCMAPIPVLEQRLTVEMKNSERESATVETARQLLVCYSLAAGKTAEQLKSNGQDAAAVHRLRGDVLLRLKGDAAGAQQEYQQAIAQQSDDPTLLERLAEAQFQAGDLDGARQSAKAALAIDPHQRESMHMLATIAMNERSYDVATPILTKLAEETPNDLGVQVELGRALVQTGQPGAALEHLQLALDKGYPDEKGALHAMEARILRQLGRDDEAAKAADDARRRSDAFQARTKEGGRETTRAHQ